MSGSTPEVNAIDSAWEPEPLPEIDAMIRARLFMPDDL